MAAPIVPDGDASVPPAQTLDAQQYIDFLKLLESSWDVSQTRAYLIARDFANRRTVQAVPADCSVFNIERDLVNQLQDDLVSTETLRQVRDICSKRLKERGHADGELLSRDRMDLAMRTIHEGEALAVAIRRTLDESDDDYMAGLVVSGMLLRLKTLMEVASTALGDEKASVEELTEMVEGAQGD